MAASGAASEHRAGTAREAGKTAKPVVKPRSGVPGGRFSVGRQNRPRGVRALGRGTIGGKIVTKADLQAAIYSVIDSASAEDFTAAHPQRGFWPSVARALGLKSASSAAVRAGAKVTNYGCATRGLFCRLMGEPEVPSVGNICVRAAAARATGASLFPAPPQAAGLPPATAGRNAGGSPPPPASQPQTPAASSPAFSTRSTAQRQTAMPFVRARFARCSTKTAAPPDAMQMLLNAIAEQED